MPAATHAVSLPAAMLERGFWLYVWRVTTPQGEILYVGPTGDSSSPHASPPFTRMGQHLGFNDKANALRRHLHDHGIAPEDCPSFELIAHGPIYPEVEHNEGDLREVLMARHAPVRNLVGAMEKALADELKAAGYDVLNTVSCRHAHDPAVWAVVRAAFAGHFPRLDQV